MCAHPLQQDAVRRASSPTDGFAALQKVATAGSIDRKWSMTTSSRSDCFASGSRRASLVSGGLEPAMTCRPAWLDSLAMSGRAMVFRRLAFVAIC
jgi:hypothetical protein